MGGLFIMSQLRDAARTRQVHRKRSSQRCRWARDDGTDAMRQQDRLLDAVGDHDCCYGTVRLRAERSELLLKGFTGECIEGAEGVVQEEDLRLGRHGASD